MGLLGVLDADDIQSVPTELQPSLTDLLDFVDRTFDSPESASTNEHSASSTTSPVMERQKATPPPPLRSLQTSTEHGRVKKTRGASAQASRLYRDKKRKEMAGLRDQVAALKNQLATLNHYRSRSRRLEHSAREWLGASQLLAEKSRLQDAELLNQELKAAVAQHLRVATAISEVLRQAAVFVDLPMVPSPTEPYNYQSGSNKPKEMIKHELLESLGHLYVASIATFAKTDRAKLDGTTSRLQHKRDPVSGRPFVEVQHSAILPITMTTAVQAFRRSMITCFSSPDPSSSQSTHDMRCVAEFRDKSRSVKLDVLRISRIYNEADRYVFTAVSALFDHSNTDKLRFQDRLWLFVARSPTNPESECVIQTVFQASPSKGAAPPFVDSSAEESVDGEKSRELVLQQLGSVYHSAIQRIQKAMVLGLSAELSSKCVRVQT